MLNLAVFASTKGTDLQTIIDAIKSGQLADVDLKFVLSDKKDCYAIERAKQAGIQTIFIDPKGLTRKQFDEKCLKVCEQRQVDLIILIGYMRIISKVLIDSYKNRIMNIHPSLLPKYPGMDLDVHAEVLKNKETETGCTLHWVTEDLDAGPIIIQEKVPVKEGDTPESLKRRVQAKEKEIIIRGVEEFRDKSSLAQ